jgi:hypothetical protein
MKRADFPAVKVIVLLLLITVGIANMSGGGGVWFKVLSAVVMTLAVISVGRTPGDRWRF